MGAGSSSHLHPAPSLLCLPFPGSLLLLHPAAVYSPVPRQAGKVCNSHINHALTEVTEDRSMLASPERRHLSHVSPPNRVLRDNLKRGTCKHRTWQQECSVCEVSCSAKCMLRIKPGTSCTQSNPRRHSSPTFFTVSFVCGHTQQCSGHSSNKAHSPRCLWKESYVILGLEPNASHTKQCSTVESHIPKGGASKE